MASEITKAIQMLCDEKKLSFEAVMETIEAALAAAYRKDFGNKQQNIKVKFDPETGDMQAWDVKTVVEDIDEETLTKAQEEMTALREKARLENRELTEEEVAHLPRFNPKNDIMVKDAKELPAAGKKVKVGDVLEIPLEIPHAFGRMAAQTAKQVVIQKVREAERTSVFGEFKNLEHTIIQGTVQRIEARKILVDLGKLTGVLPLEQQMRGERFRPGGRIKAYVVSVDMTIRGPEVLLSRAHPDMVKEVFKQEIPEVADGAIVIKGVAREPGYRAKVAVAAVDESLDPIGSCIGQRGSRISTIIEELGGEKVDLIEFREDPAEYIARALAPAKVAKVTLHNVEHVAVAEVVPDQFSLAIGRSGQNVRLASDLTGWRITVKEQGGAQEATSEGVVKGEGSETEEVKEEAKEEKE